MGEIIVWRAEIRELSENACFSREMRETWHVRVTTCTRLPCLVDTRKRVTYRAHRQNDVTDRQTARTALT